MKISWHTLGYAALVFLTAAALAWGWWANVRAGRAEAARRTAEQAALEAEGVATVQYTSAAELAGEVDRLTARSSELERQVARVRETAPSAKPEVVIDWSTGPVEIPCPQTDASEPEDGAPGPPPFAIDVRGQQLQLVTDAGNRALVGTVDVWRVVPPPEELLARRPVRFDQVIGLTPGDAWEPRWGVGPTVGLLNGRLVYGGTLALPPARFRAAWRDWQVDAQVTAVAGEGEWGVLVTALGRW